MYLLTEDGFNGVLHLCGIIDVDGPDVRPSDVNLSVRVLGGQLGSKVKHTSDVTDSEHKNSQ